MKLPKRDRHSLDVTKSIAKTYQPRPVGPGKAAKTVLKKTMRTKKKP